MQQRQIDYTRSNESEADRIGIQTLARSRLRPGGDGRFLHHAAGALARQRRRLLRAHRRTTCRPTRSPSPASAKPRSAPRGSRSRAARRGLRTRPGRPPIRSGHRAAAVLARRQQQPAAAADLDVGRSARPSGGTGQFEWARERLRVLSANTPGEAIARVRAPAPTQARSSPTRSVTAWPSPGCSGNQAAAAAADLRRAAAASTPATLWLSLAHGRSRSRAAARTPPPTRASKRCCDSMPNNRAVVLTYAEVLTERSDADAGKRAQAVLRPLLGSSGDDPMFQQTFARASETGRRPDPRRRGLCRGRLPERPPRTGAGPAQDPEEAQRPGLLRPRPDRCAHRRDHPDGARTAAARASATRTCSGVRPAASGCRGVRHDRRHATVTKRVVLPVTHRHKTVVYGLQGPCRHPPVTACRSAS